MQGSQGLCLQPVLAKGGLSPGGPKLASGKNRDTNLRTAADHDSDQNLSARRRHAENQPVLVHEMQEGRFIQQRSATG